MHPGSAGSATGAVGPVVVDGVAVVVVRGGDDVVVVERLEDVVAVRLVDVVDGVGFTLPRPELHAPSTRHATATDTTEPNAAAPARRRTASTAPSRLAETSCALFASQQNARGGDRRPAVGFVERPRPRQVCGSDIVGHAVAQQNLGGDDVSDVSAHGVLPLAADFARVGDSCTACASSRATREAVRTCAFGEHDPHGGCAPARGVFVLLKAITARSLA